MEEEQKFYSVVRSPANTVDPIKQRELQVIYEYESLQAFSAPGVYVLPSFENVWLWGGVIFVRSGIYKNSIFKFQLEIPFEYPASPPTVTFTSEVLHPLIHRDTKILSLTPRFRRWRPHRDFIFLLLYYLKDVFYSQELWTEQNSVDLDAFRLYVSDIEQFARELTRVNMQNNDNLLEHAAESPVKFSVYTSFHRKILEMMKGKDPTLPEAELCESFMGKFKKEFK